MALETSDKDFDTDVIEDSKNIPVLVDFWAEWCGPCKQLSPIIEELSTELEGKVKVVKVNIDQNPESPAKFGVRGIPTLIIFKDGEAAETKVGSVPKSTLTEWVNSALNA